MGKGLSTTVSVVILIFIVVSSFSLVYFFVLSIDGENSNSTEVLFQKDYEQINVIVDSFDKKVSVYKNNKNIGEINSPSSTISVILTNKTDRITVRSESDILQSYNYRGEVRTCHTGLFKDPLLSSFSEPTKNTGQLDKNLCEDLNGNSDGLGTTQTVRVFGQLIRGNSLNGEASDGTLTDRQARSLNWDDSSPKDVVKPGDMVALFRKQIRSKSIPSAFNGTPNLETTSITMDSVGETNTSSLIINNVSNMVALDVRLSVDTNVAEITSLNLNKSGNVSEYYSSTVSTNSATIRYTNIEGVKPNNLKLATIDYKSVKNNSSTTLKFDVLRVNKTSHPEVNKTEGELVVD